MRGPSLNPISSGMRCSGTWCWGPPACWVPRVEFQCNEHKWHARSLAHHIPRDFLHLDRGNNAVWNRAIIVIINIPRQVLTWISEDNLVWHISVARPGLGQGCVTSGCASLRGGCETSGCTQATQAARIWLCHQWFSLPFAWYESCWKGCVSQLWYCKYVNLSRKKNQSCASQMQCGTVWELITMHHARSTLSHAQAVPNTYKCLATITNASPVILILLLFSFSLLSRYMYITNHFVIM